MHSRPQPELQSGCGNFPHSTHRRRRSRRESVLRHFKDPLFSNELIFMLHINAV
jgi:hypothetical protein